jgi:hypothetical protein
VICPTPESLLTDPLLELNGLTDRRRSTRPVAFLAAAVPVPPEDAIRLAEVQDERLLALPWHLALRPVLARAQCASRSVPGLGRSNRPDDRLRCSSRNVAPTVNGRRKRESSAAALAPQIDAHRTGTDGEGAPIVFRPPEVTDRKLELCWLLSVPLRSRLGFSILLGSWIIHQDRYSPYFRRSVMVDTGRYAVSRAVKTGILSLSKSVAVERLPKDLRRRS